MNKRREELAGIYASMTTDALLELHAAGTLTDDAYDVLESVLESRSVPVPPRPVEEPRKTSTHRGARWARWFAVVGTILPLVCLVLDFRPGFVMRMCEIFWPSGFMLLAAEGHFDLAIVVISIIANAFIWAGIGWLVGYSVSNMSNK